MGEIGAGSGSSYPGTLDTNATVEVDSPNPGKTKAKAATVNDLAACILAIETELGVDPAGSKATVVARIDQEHNADGSHKDSLIVTVSGHNQNITGRKVFASGISLGVDGLYGTSTGYVTGKTTVGASGSVWGSDDIKTAASMTAQGQMNAESFTQSATRLSAGLNAEYHNGLKVKVMDIGGWDMDTQAAISLLHGLGSSAVFYAVDVWINSDLGTPFIKYPLTYFDGTIVAGAISKSATQIVLERTAGGNFDNTDFNSLTANRGTIVIWYMIP